MVEHCENCYCEPERLCGIKRSLLVKMFVVPATLAFIALGFLMLSIAKKTNFKKWGEIQYPLFMVMVSTFFINFSLAVLLEIPWIVKLIWSIVRGTFGYFWDFLHFLWRRLIIPSRQNIRVRYSRQPALALPECPLPDDSDEEPPELPPKLGFILKTDPPQPPQRLTTGSKRGASSSAARSDRRQTEADPWNLPGCSGMQSASTSQNQSKGAIPKKGFWQMWAEVNKLKTTEKFQGGSGSQELSTIEIPLSGLIKTQSTGSTTRETSFCSGSQRQARKFHLKGIKNMGKSIGKAPSTRYSGLERTEGESGTKLLQREEKSGKNTSEDGHASTSGLAARRKLTSTQETKINIPRSSVQREHEKDLSVQKSPKEDSSRPSLEGAVGQQAQKPGTFSSLNLTGGNLIVRTHGGGAEADEAILSSGTDSSGSDFFFDSPMEVLDLSHIEVPILDTENEEETKDDDKKEDESEN